MTTDTERLDWLEANDALVNYADRGPHVCIHGFPENVHFYGKSFRDAIDTAMRDYTPQPKPERPPHIKHSFLNHEGVMVIMSDDSTWVYKDGQWLRP